jgi:hypothetical protein
MATNPQSNDEPVDGVGDLTVVQAITSYREESEAARRVRMSLSKRNRNAVMNVQDWSHKEEGQSSEFIPKTSSALEIFSSFIKKAMTQFGNWYSVETSEESPLTGDQVRAILSEFLSCLPTSLFNRDHTNIAHVLSDGVKVGLTEALIIFKVHGYKTRKPMFDFEKGQNSFKIEPWNLAIDLIPPENYYPDPYGRKLYEIHRTERDLVDVVRLAEQGVYDKEVVARIQTDFARQEQEALDRKRELNQDRLPPPGFRKRIVIDEFWGTIMDSDGKIVHENVTCTVANGTYLIRKPIPNPFWHGESPFVAGPLTRVPFSVFHRALFDNAVPLNEAQNELFNLMLDGGIASVWGINQLRPQYLEDSRQVSNGIAQGTTLVMNESAPPDAKVFEQVSTGNVPPDAMAMYNLLDKEFNAAALTSDIKLGLLPTKEVKATEVVEASQSQAVTLDAIISDYEWYIQKLLKKAWITIVQNADAIDVKLVDGVAGRKAALTLARLSPEERFNAFADTCIFKVFGLSATLSRAQDFQKLMAIIQALSSNPILLQTFHKKYSEDKLINHIMKMVNLNPEQFERDEQEQAQAGNELQDAAILQQLGLTGNGTQGGQGGGMTAAINQEVSPSGGT